MTLRTFLTRLIWLCVLPLVLLAALLASDHVADRRDWQDAEGRRLARTAANAVQQELAARIGALQMLAMAAPVEASGEAPVPHQTLADLYRAAGGFGRRFGGAVLLADAQGRMLFHTARPLGTVLPPLPRPAGRSALQDALATSGPAVGDLFEGPILHRPMVALAAPVPSEGGPALVLLSPTEAAPFGRALADAGLPPGWRARLLDGRGETVAEQGEAAGDAVARRYREPVAGAPWTVVLELPQAQHALPLQRVALLLALAVLAATAMGVLGGSWAGRRLSQAVRSLGEASLVPGGSPARQIAEVAQARMLLADSAHARDRAEAERRDSEQRFRASLQQAALDLQMREAQLRGVLESASDAIITADASQAIVMANAAAARLFGIDPKELVGMPLANLMPERFRAAHGQAVRHFGQGAASTRHMGGMADLRALRADGTEFPIDASISQLQVDGRQLFTVILRDISEQRRVHEELRSSQADLRRLVAAQDSVQEAERTRIARELHDELQQTLAAIRMEVSAAMAGGPAAAGGAQPALARIEQLAGSAITSTRRIVDDLRPLMLEDLGLVPALAALAKRFAGWTGIACRFEAPGSADEAAANAPAAVASCLYRVAQEALNNVAKHAHARSVSLRLEAGEGLLRLVVRDDGTGLRPHERRKPAALGLLGMSERVRAIGGTLLLEGRPGLGTTVEVTVPQAAEPRASGPA